MEAHPITQLFPPAFHRFDPDACAFFDKLENAFEFIEIQALVAANMINRTMPTRNLAVFIAGVLPDAYNEGKFIGFEVGRFRVSRFRFQACFSFGGLKIKMPTNSVSIFASRSLYGVF